MYDVDERDVVIALPDPPPPEVGAPVPAIVASEHHLQLAYIATTSIAVITLTHPYAHIFRAPNDEAFEGHPLASRGLEPYGCFRVENSSWLRRLERVNEVHDNHSPAKFARLTHYIFAFHDSTFECAAESMDWEQHSAYSPRTLSIDIRP